jgi:TonB family protein
VVGRRASGAGLVVAFSEPITFLERRIRMFTRHPKQDLKRALPLALLGMVFGMAALAAEDPSAPRASKPGVPETYELLADQQPSWKDIAKAPTFTPMTVPPALKNAPEVQRQIARNYPPLLKDAGIGGKVVLWFLIDETGVVRVTQLHTSSGYAALDDAALKVAANMQFTAAKNRDNIVPVWVQIPITFSAKPPISVSAQRERADLEKVLDQRAGFEREAATPVFTPMTQPPALRNGPEVERALQRAYPADMRDAGIGGQTIMWFYIDETGDVVQTKVHTSSGHAELDEAASMVARIMRFAPAKNRDRIVPVWVQIPITFSAR